MRMPAPGGARSWPSRYGPSGSGRDEDPCRGEDSRLRARQRLPPRPAPRRRVRCRPLRLRKDHDGGRAPRRGSQRAAPGSPRAWAEPHVRPERHRVGASGSPSPAASPPLLLGALRARATVAAPSRSGCPRRTNRTRPRDRSLAPASTGLSMRPARRFPSASRGSADRHRVPDQGGRDPTADP